MAAILFIPMKAEAVLYLVQASTGWNSNCVSSAPCNASTQVVTQAVIAGASGGVDVTVIHGEYNSTNPATAQSDWDWDGTVSPYNTTPGRVGIYWNIHGEIPPNSDSLFASSCAVVYRNWSGAPWTVHESSYIIFSDMYMENGSGGAGQILDSNHIKMKRLGAKNAHRRTNNFGTAFAVNSENNGGATETGSSDNLLEDCWVVGISKYAILLGGTVQYSERNRVNRGVVRWDGSSPPGNPTGSIVAYGQTGSDPDTDVQGARNEIFTNSLVLDNNNCTSPHYGGGDTCYGAFYHPHSATNIRHYGEMAINLGTNYRGFMVGEDSASGIQFHHSVIWQVGGNSLFSANSASSSTFRNVTIYEPNSNPSFNSGTHSLQNSVWYRSASPNALSTSAANGAFPSTGTTGTFATNADPNLVYITSPNPNASAYFKHGLNGESIGAHIMFRWGIDNALWGDTGYDVLSSTPLFNPDYPYGGRIKSLFCAPDTGTGLTDLPDNDPLRGWCSTTKTLAEYIVLQATTATACPNDICIGQAAACGGTTLTPSFSNASPTQFTVSWSSAGNVSFNVVMSSNSNYSAPVSSDALATNTTTYLNLTQNVTYYFQVKVATEAECAYSAVISTCFVISAGSSSPAPSSSGRSIGGGSGRNPFTGGGRIYNRIDLWKEN